MNPNVDNVPVKSLDVPEDSENRTAAGGPLNANARPQQQMTVGMTLPNLGAAGDPTSSAPVLRQQSQKPAAAAGDEDDLSIEKEAVAKAKAIMLRTRNDPYIQARELNKVKAELLKRRFGKDLKLSEG